MKKQRIIFHIDMDAFFASCEEAINPELKKKPLIVGGTKKDTRSIVACPNYLARAKGVKTAMPITHALLLVPEANFIRSTKGLYSDYAGRVREIFYKYTPVVEPVSIDEAYMDVTGVMHAYNGDYEKLAMMIKNDIKETLNITCSIGIATNKLCAKIGSKFNKPDGITVVPFGKEKEFLAKLPIARIPGAGKHTQERLRKYGIELIEDILKFDMQFYDKEIGMHTNWLLNVANGIDEREVNPDSYDERKSLSKENTFSEDINDMEFLRRELYSLMEKACSRLRKDKLKSRTVTVKVKYFDFKINQKSLTRERYSNLEVDFYEDALILLDKLMEKRKRVRLLGVRFNELIQEDNSLQETMFADNNKFEKVSEKMDKLREKYNFNIIKFGKNF